MGHGGVCRRICIRLVSLFQGDRSAAVGMERSRTASTVRNKHTAFLAPLQEYGVIISSVCALAAMTGYAEAFTSPDYEKRAPLEIQRIITIRHMGLNVLSPYLCQVFSGNSTLVQMQQQWHSSHDHPKEYCVETMILASALIPRFSITSVPSHVEVLECVGHSQLKLAIDVASRSTVVSLSLSLTLSHSLTHSLMLHIHICCQFKVSYYW